MEGSVKNMRNKKTNATRSMTETLPYAVGMEERGNESVISMFCPTQSVRGAWRKVFLYKQRKSIISYHYHKAEHMIKVTLLHSVKSVMQGFMQKMEIDGTRGRGGANLCYGSFLQDVKNLLYQRKQKAEILVVEN